MKLPPHVEEGVSKDMELSGIPQSPSSHTRASSHCPHPGTHPVPAASLLALLQHHTKAVAETLVTFRSQPAARLGLPGFSPTGEGVPAQRPCGDMSLGCRSLREERWALRVSPAWEKVLFAQTPNNQSPHNTHWVLVPWLPKGHLPKAPSDVWGWHISALPTSGKCV